MVIQKIALDRAKAPRRKEINPKTAIQATEITEKSRVPANFCFHPLGETSDPDNFLILLCELCVLCGQLLFSGQKGIINPFITYLTNGYCQTGYWFYFAFFASWREIAF